MLLDENFLPYILSSLTKVNFTSESPWSDCPALGGVYEQDMEIKYHANQDNGGTYWLVKGTVSCRPYAEQISHMQITSCINQVKVNLKIVWSLEMYINPVQTELWN